MFTRINKNAAGLITAFITLICANSFAQLTANAGPDKLVCPGVMTTIGGTPSASGGLAPYTYSWSPSTFLSSTSMPNPSCTATTYISYTLTVTDDTGAVAYDQLNVDVYYIAYTGAGNDTSVCENSTALLGNDQNISGAGVTYSWLPSTYLDNNTLPRPTCTPTSSITYTLTTSTAGCGSYTDMVTVNLIPTPGVNAGPDITINEGEVATLQAGGGYFYGWYPEPIEYWNTPSPDVEPIITTTYYLLGWDASHTCPATDSVVVNVNPSDELVFYNTFTPNGDGNNDTWYIGNIWKYPNNHLEIYNRNGRLVYKVNQYNNLWDGRAFGEALPEGTYFYVLDLGDSKGVKNGTVTIID